MHLWNEPSPVGKLSVEHNHDKVPYLPAQFWSERNTLLIDLDLIYIVTSIDCASSSAHHAVASS